MPVSRVIVSVCESHTNNCQLSSLYTLCTCLCDCNCGHTNRQLHYHCMRVGILHHCRAAGQSKPGRDTGQQQHLASTAHKPATCRIQWCNRNTQAEGFTKSTAQHACARPHLPQITRSHPSNSFIYDALGSLTFLHATKHLQACPPPRTAGGMLAAGVLQIEHAAVPAWRRPQTCGAARLRDETWGFQWAGPAQHSSVFKS